MRASELLLIVRAQNQASGALRSVARDMRAMSDLGGMQQRAQSLQVARQQLNMQRQRAVNELESIESGRRSLALQKAQHASSIATLQSDLRRSGVQKAMRENDAATLRNMAQQSRLSRQMAHPLVTSARRNELAMQLEAAKLSAANLSVEEERLTSKMQIANAAIEKQQVALAELSAREREAGNRASMLRSQIATYDDRLRLNAAQIDENSKAMRRMPWERVSSGGKILQHVARVGEYAGLVLGGSLAVMAHGAAQFETSVTLAATQTRRIGQSFTQTAKNSKVLQGSIRGLMTQFPASAQDMSKAAYDIYSSLNVTLPGGVKLLKLFNQAAVAGQTSLDEVTQAGITVMNDFRIKVPQASKAFQTMFAAVRFGRMTFQQFVSMMPQLAPAFAAAGFGIGEMAKAAAFATRVMPKMGMASAGLARLTEMFARKDFIAGAKKMGVSITDVHNRLLSLPTIIDRLSKKFPTLARAMKTGRGDVALQNFFKDVTALGSGKAGTTGTIQGRRLFQFFVTQAKLAHQVYKQVGGDQNEFTNALKAMEKTTGVRWGVFVNQLKALALEIGTDVIPELLRLKKPIEDIVNWWQRLDAGTRAQAARFATLSAVFLLVGGAVTFLLGTFMRIFAVLGKFGGLSGATVATLVGIYLAVEVLTGNINGLSSALDNITNFAFGSWTGFAVTLGVAAVAAVKLTSALRGMAAAEATVGKGGLLSGLLGIGGRVATGARIGLGAGGLRGMFAGASAGAAGLGATLGPVAAIVAAIGGGLLLWKLHMMGAAAEAKKVKEAFDIGAQPRRFGDQFQQLVGSTESVERARINIRGINREITNLTKQLSGARGGRRLEILDQLKSLTMDRADAMNALAAATQKNNRHFNAFAKQLGSFVAIKDKARDLAREIGRMQDQLQRPGGARNTGEIADRVRQLKDQFNALQQQAIASSAGVQKTFNQIIRGWAKIGEFKMPTPKIAGDLFNTARRMGRMLTIPEVRALIKAEVDPASARALPGKIGAIFRGVKAQRIKIEADDKSTANVKAAQLKLPKALRFPAFSFPSPASGIKKAHAVAQNAMKPINAHIKVHPPGAGELATIGAGISAGIQANMPAVHQSVVRDVTVNPFLRTLGIKSPSSVMHKEVGIPMVQGIVQGILSQKGQVEKSATATIAFFESAAIQKAQEAKKKISNALLITDMSMQAKTLTQFNNAISKLGRRRVPKDLIDQLAALGPDQAKLISQIANMSEKELRRYVAAWRKANGQVKRSMRETQEDIRNSTKDYINGLVDSVSGLFDSILQQNQQNFGELFANVDPATYGEGFKQAMDDYRQNVADFQSQLSDLNKQLADLAKQKTEQLTQAFGPLFSGEWLTGEEVQRKIDWGQKLGFDDLFKDLQGQITKFNNWKNNLTSLAKRIPPALARELAALGPEAADKIAVLNDASDAQLKDYVALWNQSKDSINQAAKSSVFDTQEILDQTALIVAQIQDITTKLADLKMPHELTGQDLIDSIDKQIAQFGDYQNVLQQLIDRGLPAEFVQQLAALGPDALPLLKGLVSMSDDQLKEMVGKWDKSHSMINDATVKMLNEQLTIWFSYGRKIADQMIAGMSSQAGKLTDYFKQIILALLQNKPIPPPPPLDTTPVTNTHTSTSGSTTKLPGEASTAGSNNNNSNTIVHMTVNATADESLDSILRRATFRLENR